MTSTSFEPVLDARRDDDPPVAPEPVPRPHGPSPPNVPPPAAIAHDHAQGQDQAQQQFIKQQGQIRQAIPLRLKHAWNGFKLTRFVLRRIFLEMMSTGCREVNMLMMEHGFTFRECEWHALCPKPDSLELIYPCTTKQNFVMALLYESMHEAIHPDQYK